MKHHILLLLVTLTTILNNQPFIVSARPLATTTTSTAHSQYNKTVYEISKQLCWNCMGESLQFLFGHNLVRARKMEAPLLWDSQLADYAHSWAGQRQSDCELIHSFQEGDFKLGENIYLGTGPTWSPMDAVSTWAGEEKYYSYKSNSCVEGQMCGHYTQIVWSNTKKVGCARVVCGSGDVFMTCNYAPPGNIIGEKPY